MSGIEIRTADIPVCDFCGSREPAWEYSAEDFVEGAETPLPQVSVGAWLACDPCASCIQRNDWDGLAELGLLNSSASVLVALVGKKEAMAMMHEFHAKFRSHRDRKVVRYEKRADAVTE
jgi:hypothetical protein